MTRSAARAGLVISVKDKVVTGLIPIFTAVALPLEFY
jgi:hypothetical protein